MAFTRVNGLRKYFKYAECTKGQTLVHEAVYLGQEEGKFGIQHLFKEKTGETVVLNSSGHLNYMLDEYVAPGQLCNVIYDEQKVLTKGPFKGKPAHNFIVEVDDSGVTHDPTKIADAPVADNLTL